MGSNSLAKETRPKPKTTSTISWVSDKLAAGAARVNGGEFQDVEIAVVKATNHDIVTPKEKHVRTLREIIATSQNRKKVIYIVHALYERLLTPNESWLVVLKTLMVFHKLLKSDGEATFKQEMIRYKEKRKLTGLLRLNNFADSSQKECWDFSAFVRVYSSYLEERLTVFETIKFDVDRDGGGANVRFKTASGAELLTELPKVQKMLQRILACVPEGAAAESEVVMESMRALLTECFRLYRVISEGVINLAEQFFEMDRIDASKGLEMYRESINGSAQMQTFFNAIQNLSIGRQIQFPQLTSPPEEFLQQMEEYVKGATGRTTIRKFQSTISRNARGTPSAALATGSDRAASPVKLVVNMEKKKEQAEEEEEETQPQAPDDLLGLLDLSDPVPVVTSSVPAPADPFGDTVFRTTDVPKDGGLLDDWGQSASLLSPTTVSPVAAEQNASPFDDFWGGGPMAQPPPAPDSSSPGSYIHPPPFQSPLQGSGGAPMAPPQLDPFPQAPPAMPSNNPFGGGAFETVPSGSSIPQPTYQPSPQMPVNNSPAPSFNVQAALPVHGVGGTFSGPGAFADPFEDLMPTMKRKTSFALPGVPMRQESVDSNPFGGNPSGLQPQQRAPPGPQGHASFF